MWEGCGSWGSGLRVGCCEYMSQGIWRFGLPMAGGCCSLPIVRFLSIGRQLFLSSISCQPLLHLHFFRLGSLVKRQRCWQEPLSGSQGLVNLICASDVRRTFKERGFASRLSLIWWIVVSSHLLSTSVQNFRRNLLLSALEEDLGKSAN